MAKSHDKDASGVLVKHQQCAVLWPNQMVTVTSLLLNTPLIIAHSPTFTGNNFDVVLYCLEEHFLLNKI
jgi:hypothetical protein